MIKYNVNHNNEIHISYLNKNNVKYAQFQSNTLNSQNVKYILNLFDHLYFFSLLYHSKIL